MIIFRLQRYGNILFLMLRFCQNFIGLFFFFSYLFGILYVFRWQRADLSENYTTGDCPEHVRGVVQIRSDCSPDVSKL